MTRHKTIEIMRLVLMFIVIAGVASNSLLAINNIAKADVATAFETVPQPGWTGGKYPQVSGVNPDMNIEIPATTTMGEVIKLPSQIALPPVQTNMVSWRYAGMDSNADTSNQWNMDEDTVENDYGTNTTSGQIGQFMMVTSPLARGKTFGLEFDVPTGMSINSLRVMVAHSNGNYGDTKTVTSVANNESGILPYYYNGKTWTSGATNHRTGQFTDANGAAITNWSSIQKVFITGTNYNDQDASGNDLGLGTATNIILAGSVSMPTNQIPTGKEDVLSYPLTSYISYTPTTQRPDQNPNAYSVFINTINIHLPLDAGSLVDNFSDKDISGNLLPTDYTGSSVNEYDSIENSTMTDQKLTITVQLGGPNTVFTKNPEFVDSKGQSVETLLKNPPTITYYDSNGEISQNIASANKIEISNLTINAGTTFNLINSVKATSGNASIVTKNEMTKNSHTYTWSPSSTVTGNIVYIDGETKENISSEPYSGVAGDDAELHIPEGYVSLTGQTTVEIPEKGGDIDVPVYSLTEATAVNPNPSGTGTAAGDAIATTQNNGKRVNGVTITSVPSYTGQGYFGDKSINLSPSNEGAISYTNWQKVPTKVIIGVSELTNSETQTLPLETATVNDIDVYAASLPGKGLVAGYGNAIGEANDASGTIKVGDMTINIANNQYRSGKYSGLITYSVVNDALTDNVQ